MKKIIWLVLAIAIFSCAAPAQDIPRAEMSAGYSFLRLGGTGGVNQNGGNVSIAGNINSWLGIESQSGRAAK